MGWFLGIMSMAGAALSLRSLLAGDLALGA